jgi:hypothetical protein
MLADEMRMSNLTVTVVIHDRSIESGSPQEVVVSSLEELYNVCKDLDPSIYTYVQFCNKGEHAEDYLSMTLDD